jgi:hypothetical protein
MLISSFVSRPAADSAQLLPDAELVEFESTGHRHLPTMTRPGNVVEAIRRRFS